MTGETDYSTDELEENFSTVNILTADISAVIETARETGNFEQAVYDIQDILLANSCGL